MPLILHNAKRGERCLKEFGKIDVCVNNAGISKDNLLLRLTQEQWDDVMTVNLKSIYNLTRQVIRPMMKAKSGSIINKSSIIGMRGNRAEKFCSIKSRYYWFYKIYCTELGSRNIRCNAIEPGFIETDMTHYLKEGMAQKMFEKIFL